VPAGARVAAFPIVTWFYSPLYRPWVSTVYWSRYPGWWHPWRTVSFRVYRPRVVSYTRVSFTFTNRTAVVRAGAIYTAPAASASLRRATRADVKEHGDRARVKTIKSKTDAGTKVKKTRKAKRTGSPKN